MKTANETQEFIVMPTDSWRMIFVDAIVCTILFAIATALSGLFMYLVDAFVNTRLAVVYLPVWSCCMLSVMFYARSRARFHFGVVDVAWGIPVLVALAIAIDILGHSSFWVFIIAYATHVGMCYLRSLFQPRSENRSEQGDADEALDQPFWLT